MLHVPCSQVVTHYYMYVLRSHTEYCSSYRYFVCVEQLEDDYIVMQISFTD